MKNLLERLPPRSRIAVIRLRSLGDCVLTTPALALLKAHRPDLHVSVVVERRFAEMFEDNPDVDAIGEKPNHPLLALNLHGGTRSMMLTATSGAKYRVGFGHHSFSFVYTHKIPRAQEILGEERPVHTAEHLASAMFWLGVPRVEIPRAKLVARSKPNYPPYVVVHPFASAPPKAWPRERFAALAAQLQSQGWEPMILAGPADDASAFSQFQVFRNAPLSDVKNLMSGATLFVGNDSGPAHIAAAFGVPVVVLFGPSNPVTWAPWRTEARVLTSQGSIDKIALAEVSAAAESLVRTAQ
ncbi:MAG: glycosyltransferase family 9 protein [Bryobacterales bacterium]|nr:glycosyltransferase family 9 protein [Bryobacterales bacterium]